MIDSSAPAEHVYRQMESTALPKLLAHAARLRDDGHGTLISYSRKVFLPLTHLCRDTCRYCTFAQTPKRADQAYMSAEQVLKVAHRGRALGCKEALFTLGDKPEARWTQARAALEEMGFDSTLSYLEHMARLVFAETGLLPHLNPGLISADELARLRTTAPSMGLMLESVSDRLMERGGPHHGCPDKAPLQRLEVIARAGRARIPFTSGLLIGIGETRFERIRALLALKTQHERYGHIQEIIIQPFRAKPGTPMARSTEPALDDLLWTIASARIIFGAAGNIQSPPNLAPTDLPHLLAAGINDFGGISPLTPDYVNPEAPWPHLDDLAAQTAACGKHLIERLTIYPSYARRPDEWTDAKLARSVRDATDAAGWPREDDWTAGIARNKPRWVDSRAPAIRLDGPVSAALRRAEAGQRLDEAEIVTLFAARGSDFFEVCSRADGMRRMNMGNAVSYVVTRNINYTNVCLYACSFCAFSKGRVARGLRSAPYMVDLDEIARRTHEAYERGATEVCLQGGIHPSYTGQTYLDVLAAAKRGAAQIHVHAFSPLEVAHGARSLGISTEEFLTELRAGGLGSLPGTAAEILDDEVRALLCPDKLRTDEWLAVMRTAHELGLKTTSTIMYGHVDAYVHWARHLLRLRDLQAQTGGFTEFVPLAFVASEAPIYRRGLARRGPSFREAVLMHAVGRLVLDPLIRNIQTSWVKMGAAGAVTCLNAGANDFGGTLMNESITRSAGAVHGEELPPAALESLIRQAGRTPRQRTTLYGEAGAERLSASLSARPLAPIVERSARRAGASV